MGDSLFRTVGRVVATVVGITVAAVAGFLVFVQLPGSFAELVGVLLTLVVIGVAVRAVGSLWGSALPRYNTAEITVEGPITRESGGIGPTSNDTSADDVVDQIESADADGAVDALLVKLNTPGGEIVPSDDIRAAAVEFDGPTVAYATDVCASGGIWIASGCDELWAREGSQVGSIGVLGLRPNVSGFLEDNNVTFEEFTAGEFKDAGAPVTEFTTDDREYLQGLTDDYYEQFVDRVSEGMDLSPETVRETEARVYLGPEAREIGLVDALGDREDAIDRVEELLDDEVTVEAFEPDQGLREQIGVTARHVAYSFGAGIATHLAPEDVEFRL